MGFYDDGYEKPKPKRQKSTWFTSLMASIFGGIIAILFLPVLANMGILPYQIEMNSEVAGERVMTNEHTQERITHNVQVNVQSNVIDAVESVSEAIVGVINIQHMSDFFNRDVQEVERGTGSGVIFDIVEGKAHIVTNYHVVENARQVEISLANGERVEATLIGADSLTDLAVLEIDAEHVDTVANFGDSDAIRTGEPAIAIGNPLGLEFSRTVTQGIISAKERSVAISPSWEINVIQTDAAINPGNSGGALINIEGQVIGINSLKISQRRTDSFGSSVPIEGLGFAIPINDAIPVIHDLIEHGEVLRPYMGVEIRDLAEVDSYHWQETLKLPQDVKQGVVIMGIQPMSAAQKAGLKELDVIKSIDGQEIPTSIELRKYLFSQKNVGDTIEVRVYRDGIAMTVELTLEKGRTAN